MRPRNAAAVGAAALLGAVLAGALGSASGAATSGAVKVWVTPSATQTTGKHHGKVLFTGAIGDYGATIAVNAAGKQTKRGTYRLLKLTKGTILVNISQLNKAIGSASSAPSTFNSTTCSIVVNASAPLGVVRGTGAYAGITGSITMTARFAAIVPRASSGTCTTGTSASPMATYASITGVGSISVP